MKKIITLSTVSLNLIIFTTALSLISATSDVIYDSSGNKLLRGIPYYILPLLRGSGGGLTLSQTTKNTCPLNVTQEPFELSNGVPFTFNPIILDEEVIRGAYPISIEADVINPCTGSKIWMVTKSAIAKTDDDDVILKWKKKDDDDDDDDNDDDDDEKKFVGVEIVTVGGEFNKPESCFQFVENDMMPGLLSYQIQHCPFKCGLGSSGVLSCYNVGIVTDGDGNGYLGRTDAIYAVVFTSSFGSFRSAKRGTFSQLSAKVTAFNQLVD